MSYEPTKEAIITTTDVLRLRRVLDVLSLEQLEQVAECVQRVRTEGNGHGEVTIKVIKGTARFVSVTTSDDLARGSFE